MNATVKFIPNSRQITAIFHDPDFHKDLALLHSKEREQISALPGEPFAFNGKVFLRLSNTHFAPAVLRTNGPVALAALAQPSPHEVFRRLDIDTISKIMDEADLVYPEQNHLKEPSQPEKLPPAPALEQQPEPEPEVLKEQPAPVQEEPPAPALEQQPEPEPEVLEESSPAPAEELQADPQQNANAVISHYDEALQRLQACKTEADTFSEWGLVKQEIDEGKLSFTAIERSNLYAEMKNHVADIRDSLSSQQAPSTTPHEPASEESAASRSTNPDHWAAEFLNDSAIEAAERFEADATEKREQVLWFSLARENADNQLVARIPGNHFDTVFTNDGTRQLNRASIDINLKVNRAVIIRDSFALSAPEAGITEDTVPPAEPDERNEPVVHSSTNPEDDNTPSPESSTDQSADNSDTNRLSEEQIVPINALNEHVEELTNTLKGKTLDQAAKLLSVPKRKHGESIDDRQQRLRSVNELISSILLQSPAEFKQNNQVADIQSKLDLLNLSKRGNKQALIDRIFGHIASLGQRYAALVDSSNVLQKITLQKHKGEPILLEDIGQAKGPSALSYAMVYTPGDVQVAAALNSEVVAPKGQRGQSEKFYDAMESFLSDPLGRLEQAGYLNSPEFDQYLAKRRSIQNNEIIEQLMAKEFAGFLPNLELPDGIATHSCILELDDALKESDFDLSYQPLPKKDLSEDPEPAATNGNTYVLPEKFSDTAERWNQIKSGDLTPFSYEQKLIELVQEAQKNGVTSFSEATKFITSNHSDFFPEDFDNGSPAGAIQVEVAFAWQYTKSLESDLSVSAAEIAAETAAETAAPEENIDAGSTPPTLKDESPKKQTNAERNNVTPLHVTRREKPAPQQDDNLEEKLADLEKAGISFNDLTSFITAHAALSREEELQGEISSLAVKRAQRELDAVFLDLQTKALQVGIDIDKAALVTASQEMQKAMGQLSENEDQPWKIDAETISKFTDEMFIQLGSEIPEEQKTELALFMAKRTEQDAKVRLLGNILNGEQPANPDLIDELLSEFEKSKKLYELEKEIAKLSEVSSEHLSSFQYDRLSELRSERAEILYKISEIEITPELEEIYRSTAHYDEAAQLISDKLNIDFYGAQDLNVRVSKSLHQKYIDEKIATPEFQLGLQIAGLLPDFSRNEPNNVDSIAIRDIGIHRVHISVPRFVEEKVEVYVSAYSNDRFSPGSESDLITVDLSSNDVAGDLAKQIDKFSATFKTVVKTHELPEYGSKLHSGPNGETLYDLKEINKRIRSDLKDLQNSGAIPKEVKVSITKSGSSIGIRIKSLPDSIPMINPDFAGWIEENPHGHFNDAPPRHSRDYRALVTALEAIADAYNYDKSDRYNDYINVNFYLSVEANYELAESEMDKALEAYKQSFSEKHIDDVPEAEIVEQTASEEPAANEINVELVPQTIAAEKTLDSQYINAGQPVLNYEGQQTNWVSLEIAGDELGLMPGGGTLLIHKDTGETYPFYSEGTSPQEALIHATDFAIKHAEPDSTPLNAVEEDTNSVPEKVIMPVQTSSKSAQNVAKLLNELGIADQLTEFATFTIQNQPYKDLHIEVLPSPTEPGDNLYLTHYNRQNGDSWIDAEMVFHIGAGNELRFVESATYNPFNGGELRGPDEEFAELFSNNLINQGFGTAPIFDPDNPAEREEPTESEKPTETEQSDESLVDLSHSEFKERISQIDTSTLAGEMLALLTLAYRYAEPPALERAVELDLKFYNDTLNQSDRNIVTNLQNSFIKAMDSAIKEEANNGPISTASQNREPVTTGTEGSTDPDETTGNLPSDKQPNDQQKDRNADDGISGRTSSTSLNRLSGTSGISEPNAGLPDRSNGSNDPGTDTVEFTREIDFFPRDAILENSFAQPSELQDAFRQAVETYITLKKEDRQPTEAEKLALVAIGGSGMPEIHPAFKSYGHTTKNMLWLSESLQELFRDHPDAYRSLKASTVDAYYTPVLLTEFMWDAVSKMGLQSAEHRLHITEPSIGNGRFIGLAPTKIREDAILTGIEKDAFTAEVTQMAYPEVQVVNDGFERCVIPAGTQDLVIGNPPYGDFTVYDRKDSKQRLIHDFFLKQAIDLTKPGGIVAFVTSSGTLDKKNNSLRTLIGASADLVTAFRLPRTVFEHQGAEVVTDILFFKKRMPGQSISNADWLETQEITLQDSSAPDGERTGRINQFYLNNPDHILGDLEWTSSQFGKKLTVGGSLLLEDYQSMLDKIPQGIFSASAVAHINAPLKQDSFEDPKFKLGKIGSYVKSDDGIFILTADGRVPHTITGKRAEKLSAVIELRDTLLELIDFEKAEDTESADNHRELLNNQYDAFVGKYGPLNGRLNKNLLSLDPDQYLLLALEHNNPSTNEPEKTDIFRKGFQALNTNKTKLETVSDAALFLLNHQGRIEPKEVAKLLSISESDSIEGLKDFCFKNPETAQWELSALYLSGNIYTKLEAAKNAHKFNPEYERNIKALEDVIPTPIDIHEINVRLGAAWIPLNIIRDFICQKLDTYAGDDRVQLTFVPETHTWDLRLTAAGRNALRAQNEREYIATGTIFEKLMTQTLNLKRVRITDSEGNLNPEATALAKAKQTELVDEFKRFILTKPEYSKTIADIYNRKFNGYREAIYDGSYMTFPGMSGVINGNPLQLRAHQTAIVERALYSDTGLIIAHEAGAGKTIEQIGIALEQKRLGMANKPLFVIPNHMLQQATNEARDLYPNARILTATPEDFSANGRQLFANKVRMNDWDLVICTHSMFNMMSSPAEYVKEHILTEIAEYETAIQSTADGNKIALRQLEKGKKKLESRLEAATQKLEDKQDSICFGECGFDALFYDEGHYLKNFAPATSLSDVAGVNTTTSDRALDAVIKADYVRHKRGDQKGVYLSTATPITNSVSEIWVMLRIAAPSLLKEAGLFSFDNFAATFCEVVEHIELKPEGNGYQMKARLSRFHNVPELIRLFRMAADIKTAEDLNLPTPKANEVRHVAPQSETMKLFMDWLSHRAGLIRDLKVEPSEDNILSIANDGRMASLDLRLIHEKLPDDPNSKLNLCVKEVFDSYVANAEDRRTQIVFCDRGTPKPGFNLYDDMKQKWIALGIPEHEIAFIHDAKNDSQKEAIFAKVRTGEIRILLGSTDKLGVGTNVQTRGSDLGNLDVPWRPTDLIQRRKRFERQGNLFDDLNNHFYTTEDSFDLFMLETNVRKLRFITQAMSSPEKAARRLDEDIDPSLSEIMAITSGNPLIREKVEVDSKLEQLSLLRNGHDYTCSRARSEANWIKHQMETTEEEIFNFTQALKATDSEFSITVDGQEFTHMRKAGKAIHEVIKNQFGAGNEVAQIAGYPLISRTMHDRFVLQWMGPAVVEVNLTKDPSRFTNNLKNQFEDLNSRLEFYKQRLINLTEKHAVEKAKSEMPFKQEEEFIELSAKQVQLNAEISAMEAERPPAMTDGHLHDFEALLESLNAEHGDLLTPAEIEKFQQAKASQTPSNIPSPGGF